jgi:hypothetical protein
MVRRWLRLHRCAAVVVTIALAGAASAAVGDVHERFETRCGSCHAHAGDLARKMKFDPAGRLVGVESGRDIRRFLDRHHAGDAATAEAIYALFARQTASGGEFRDRCAICHGRARELVRDRLVISGGRLAGRYSGNDVGDFLVGHANLAPAEAKFFRDVLRLIAEGR